MRGASGLSKHVFIATFVALVLSACSVPPPQSNSERMPLTWARTGEPTYPAVAYGPDPRNVADIYSPTAGGNRGVIVLVHGGGFYSGGRSEVRELSGVIMAQVERGFSVVNIDYRLLTETSNNFPNAVDDVSMAVNWVRENGPAYNLNPATLIVAGHSAGGTLAALVALGWNSPTSGALGRTAKVDGYISFAGIMNFENAAPISAAAGELWLGANAKVPGWKGAASPTTHLDPADPPGYLAHGDMDNVIEMGQVDQMISALVRSGTNYSKLFVDRVTTGEDACRWHLPQCGVNATQLNKWIDLVVDRRF